jgi:Ca2+-binding RTX toxin-like protein
MTARIVPLALLLLLAVAPTAAADSSVTYASGTIFYDDNDSEQNVVRVERISATKLQITETGASVDILSVSPDVAGCVETAAGSNVVECDAGHDVTVTTGAQGDTITFAGAPGLRDTGTAWSGDGESGNDTLTGVGVTATALGPGVTLLGGDGGDAITGTPGGDSLDGGDGPDAIRGGGGGDTIAGGPGDDLVDGGAGDDRLWGGEPAAFSDGTDQVLGSAGDDELSDGDAAAFAFPGGSPDADRLDGGSGRDRVLYLRTADVSITLAPDAPEGALTGDDGEAGERDALRQIEDVTTGAGRDSVTGSAAANRVLTGDGDDTVTTLGGNDAVESGTGRDHVDTGEGDDKVDGGPGHDVLMSGPGTDALDGGEGDDALDAGDGDDSLDGGGGNDTLAAGPGDDHLTDGDGSHSDGADGIDGGDGTDLVSYGTRVAAVTVDLAQTGAVSGEAGEGDTVVAAESVTGGAGADTLLGTTAGNELTGGPGADVIDGRDGGDALFGEAGDDSLTGGAGTDELRGGSGSDVIATSDGSADRVSCGIGTDSVSADANDLIDLDCESVSGTKVETPPVVQPPRLTATCRKVRSRRVKVSCTLTPAPRRGLSASLRKGARSLARGRTRTGGTLRLNGRARKLPKGTKTLVLNVGSQKVSYTVTGV